MQMSLLLIGSRPVFFKRIEGHFIHTSSLDIKEAEITQENVNKLLRYKKPWVSAHSHSFIGEAEEETKEADPKAGVYLPCIPSLDHVVTLKPD